MKYIFDIIQLDAIHMILILKFFIFSCICVFQVLKASAAIKRHKNKKSFVGKKKNYRSEKILIKVTNG